MNVYYIKNIQLEECILYNHPETHPLLPFFRDRLVACDGPWTSAHLLRGPRAGLVRQIQTSNGQASCSACTSSPSFGKASPMAGSTGLFFFFFGHFQSINPNQFLDTNLNHRAFKGDVCNHKMHCQFLRTSLPLISLD